MDSAETGMAVHHASLTRQSYRKSMEIIEIRAHGSHPVNHPFRILQRHRPAHTMKALDQIAAASQLSRQGADHLRIITHSFAVPFQNPG